METDQKKAIFTNLRSIMHPFGQRMQVINDEADHYEVASDKKDKKGRDIWFGAVQVKKNYVSYHLMPIYIFPDLLNDISPELKKRMQGKSCFNFKKPDEALFSELKTLTEKGFNWMDAMENAPY